MMPIATKLTAPLFLALAAGLPAHAQSTGGGCNCADARGNQPYPLKIGTSDFVPLSHDGSLGFHVVYSGRNNPVNNVGIFLFDIAGGEVLVFGAGYGDDPVATNSAQFDVQLVDNVLRNCMGHHPATTNLRFISPHWHGDHINDEFIHELGNVGWQVVEILFHEDDAPYIYSYYNWTAADEAKFTWISHGTCHEEIASFPSPLGKIWFMARKGHAPGAIDAVIDVRNNPQDRFVVLGSVPGGQCTARPSGWRNVVKAHGNAILSTTAQVVPYGCGLNTRGSLIRVNGMPTIGTTVVLGIDNPAGNLIPGAIPYLWGSSTPDSLIPCGTIVATPDLAGPEELLLTQSIGMLPLQPIMGSPWSGPGNPSTFSLHIPYDPTLVGCSFFYQGALHDPWGGAGERIVLTEGLELRIGD